jgi:putative membrane protein
MRRASASFDDKDRAQVARAVAEAESSTSAEIVPAVATASGRYDRAEDIVGLWVGALLAVIVWFLFQGTDVRKPEWGFSLKRLELPAIVVAVVGGFVLGAVVASRVGWLRALFTPRRQMRSEADARARQLFFDNRVHHTARATGLLIYVSLFERMAAIIGDQTIIEKLGLPAIEELCSELTRSLKSGNITAAICSAVKSAGERLAPVLPREGGDVNELPNALILID